MRRAGAGFRRQAQHPAFKLSCCRRPHIGLALNRMLGTTALPSQYATPSFPAATGMIDQSSLDSPRAGGAEVGGHRQGRRR